MDQLPSAPSLNLNQYLKEYSRSWTYQCWLGTATIGAGNVVLSLFTKFASSAITLLRKIDVAVNLSNMRIVDQEYLAGTTERKACSHLPTVRGRRHQKCD